MKSFGVKKFDNIGYSVTSEGKRLHYLSSYPPHEMDLRGGGGWKFNMFRYRSDAVQARAWMERRNA